MREEKLFLRYNLALASLTLLFFVCTHLKGIVNNFDSRLLILLVYFGLAYAGFYVFHLFLKTSWQDYNRGKKIFAALCLTIAYVFMFVIADMMIPFAIYQNAEHSLLFSIMP